MTGSMVSRKPISPAVKKIAQAAFQSPKTQNLRAVSLATIFMLLILAGIGMYAVAHLTANGAGASGDSVHYVDGARNILAGEGFSRLRGNGEPVPITGFPPFFSIVLAGLSWPWGDIFETARRLNGFLFGANIFLSGFLIYRANRSLVFSLIGSLFVLASYDLVGIHAWIMAEPLYIFLTLLALHVFLSYLVSHSLLALSLSGLIAGLAAITRYAGLALLAAFFLGVLLYRRTTLKRRLYEALVGLAVSLAPVLAWFIRNAAANQNLTNREVNFHPISYELLASYLLEATSWVFLNEFNLSWRWLVIVSCSILLVSLVVMGSFQYRYFRDPKSGETNRIDPLTGLIALFLVIYAIVLLVNTSFLDASTDETAVNRYLIPVFVFSMIEAILFLTRLGWPKGNWRSIQVAVASGCLVLLVFHSNQSLGLVKNPGFFFGYLDQKREWKEIVAALTSIPASRPILTNDYELVYYLAGRPPFALPHAFDHYKQEEVADYEKNMGIVRGLLQSGAVLVVIEKPEDDSPAVNELVTELAAWKPYSHAVFYVDPVYLDER